MAQAFRRCRKKPGHAAKGTAPRQADRERFLGGSISDLWNAIQKLKRDDVSTYRKVEDFAGSICQIFGLPVKNIMRDVRSAYQAWDAFYEAVRTGKNLKATIQTYTERDVEWATLKRQMYSKFKPDLHKKRRDNARHFPSPIRGQYQR